MKTSAETPSWERLIRTHTYNLQACIRTDNYAYLHAAKAIHTLTLKTQATDVDPVVKANIDEIYEADAYAKQDVAEEFTTSVDKLKEEKPDADAWKKKIQDARDKAKQMADAGIDAAADQAINYISNLPSDQRDAAADISTTAMNFVMDIIETLVSQMKNVLNSVVDYLKGIWTQVQAAFVVVKSAVESGVKFIKGIFTLSTVQLPPAISFIGRLNWPAAVAVGAATAGLAYVTNQLKAKNIVYNEQIFVVKPDGTKETTTRLIQTTDISGKIHATPETLEQAWLSCVADLGADGHWVPEQIEQAQAEHATLGGKTMSGINSLQSGH